MRRIGLAATAFSLFLILAYGSSKADAQGDSNFRLECTRGPYTSESYICNSVYLSALYRKVFDDFRMVLDVTPMKKGISADQDMWFASRIRRGNNGDLRDTMAARHRDLERILESTKFALAKRHSEGALPQMCVDITAPFCETFMLTCRVESVDGIAPGIVGQRQIWSGPQERDQGLGPMTAVAILEATEKTPVAGGRIFKVIGWVAAESATIGKPYVIDGDGKTYLTVPKVEYGSSAPSTDVVLAKFGAVDIWREIDAQSWFKELGRRFPRGLMPRSAYSLDLLTMRATVSIAKEGDLNCCPTGGTAEVGLVLKGDTLVIDSLVLRRPAPGPQTTRP